MKTPFYLYSKIAKNYCVWYAGKDLQCIEKLQDFRKKAIEKYPNIKIFLCIDDSLALGQEDVIPSSQMPKRHDEFAVINKLSSGVNIDPIVELFAKENIPM